MPAIGAISQIMKSAYERAWRNEATENKPAHAAISIRRIGINLTFVIAMSAIVSTVGSIGPSWLGRGDVSDQLSLGHIGAVFIVTAILMAVATTGGALSSGWFGRSRRAPLEGLRSAANRLYLVIVCLTVTLVAQGYFAWHQLTSEAVYGGRAMLFIYLLGFATFYNALRIRIDFGKEIKLIRSRFPSVIC